jgi:general secretion pathway protein J
MSRSFPDWVPKRVRARRRPRRRGEAGFTLIEVLISSALMGAVIAAIATVTAQWVPNWNRGFAGIQRDELLAFGLERLVSDLAAAEFVLPKETAMTPLFDGGQLGVTFVRNAVGPNARPSLDLVRYMEVGRQEGPALVRTHTPFVPVDEDAQPSFTDAVIVVRSPFRITFSFAGRDRVWQNTWQNLPLLPRAVRFQVRDAATLRVLAVSTAMLVHADVPPDCVQAQSLAECFNPDRKRGNSAGAEKPAPNTGNGGRP